jgi:hypothetical protein
MNIVWINVISEHQDTIFFEKKVIQSNFLLDYFFVNHYKVTHIMVLHP